MERIGTSKSGNNVGDGNSNTPFPTCQSPYLNHRQAAAYLGIKESSLYGMIYRGKITPLKVGGLNRFRQEDLDKFVQECSQEAVAKRKPKLDG